MGPGGLFMPSDCARLVAQNGGILGGTALVVSFTPASLQRPALTAQFGSVRSGYASHERVVRLPRFQGDLQPLTQPGPPARAWQWMRKRAAYLLLMTTLAAGVGNTVYLNQQRLESRERLQNLEAEWGATFHAVEMPDGSVMVINRMPDIPAHVVRTTAPASVFVQGQRGNMLNWGSGVVIRDAAGHYYVVTNEHVVDNPTDSGTFKVFPYRSSRAYEAEVVSASESPDLALLRITDEDFEPEVFLDAGRFRDLDVNPLQEGEQVFMIGNPNQDRHRILPGVLHFRNNGMTVQFLAPCDHGASGGPIFDMQGRLIGIEELVTDPPGRCTGIRVDVLTDWLAEQGRPIRGEVS